LVHGCLGAGELSEAALGQKEILRLSECVELIEDAHFSSQFPARRYARVIVETSEGERYDSGEVEARWDAEDPPSDEDLTAKFRWLAQDVWPDDRVDMVADMIWRSSDLADAASLLDAVL